MKTCQLFSTRLLLAVALGAGIVWIANAPVQAASYTWTNKATGSFGYWTNGILWGQVVDTTYPTNSDSAYLTNTISTGTYTTIFDYSPGIGTLTTLVISNSGAGQARLIVTNAQLNVATNVLGRGSVLQIDSGGIVSNTASFTWLGNNGVVYLNNGGRLFTTGAISFNTAGVTGTVTSASAPGTGGTWNFNGANMYVGLKVNNVRFTVDNATLTNVGTVTIGSFDYFNTGSGNYTGNSLTISNGARLYSGDVMVGFHNGSGGSTYNVGGLGAASVVSNGWVVVGWASSNNRINVTNATLQVSSLYVAYSSSGNGFNPDSAGNVVSVYNQGTIQVLGSGGIYVGSSGNNGKTRFNKLEIYNGGFVSAGGVLNVGAGAPIGTPTSAAHDNQVIVTDGGQLVTAGARIGLYGTNNWVTVSGGPNGTSIWNASGGVIIVGTNNNYNGLTIDGAGGGGGAVVTNVSQLRIGTTWINAAGANNNSVLLTNGARLFSTGTITVGYADGQISNVANNNTLKIVGGAADSILSAGGGSLIVGQSGYGNNNNHGLAFANGVLVGAGGIATNVGTVVVGYVTKTQGNTSSTVRATNNWLQVTAGGRLFSTANSYIGYNVGGGAQGTNLNNSITITGADSLWNLGGATLFIGNVASAGGISSNNALIVSSGGMVTNLGTLAIGAGGAVGNQLKLEGGQLYASSLTATGNGNRVTFNAGTLSANNITYSNGTDFVVGDGSSAATLQLRPGTHVFQNNLVVTNNGVLFANGTITSSSAAVSIYGTLGGTGTINRVVNINTGGTLSPGNSIGKLTVSNLTLASSANLNFELGTNNVDGAGNSLGLLNNDLVAVKGDLTLAGNLNITGLDGFGPGTNRLFTYTGTLNNQGLTIGTLINVGGRVAGDFSIITGSGYVDLVVIPEPSALTLVGLGLLGSVMLRRFARRRA